MVHVGDTIKKEIVIDETLVKDFAQVSGDYNPIHLDDTYAASTRFGKRIVHGMLLGVFISAILANELPGPGTIYLEQNLQFKSPLYIGEYIEICVTCTEILSKSRARLSTRVSKKNGTVVLSGEAIVIAPN